MLKIRPPLEYKGTAFIYWECHYLCDCYLACGMYKYWKNFSIYSILFRATMRFIHFTIVVCVLSFSIQSGSGGFLLDAFRQGFQTTVGFIKDIPNRIPTPNEVFEFGKNVLIGFPLELSISVVHEFCKYLQYIAISVWYNSLCFIPIFAYCPRCCGIELKSDFGKGTIYTTNRENVIHFAYKRNKFIHSDHKSFAIMATSWIQTTSTVGDFCYGLENEFKIATIWTSRCNGQCLLMPWQRQFCGRCFFSRNNWVYTQ